MIRCIECDKRSKYVHRFDGGYGSVYVCLDCLKDALLLLEGARALDACKSERPELTHGR